MQVIEEGGIGGKEREKRLEGYREREWPAREREAEEEYQAGKEGAKKEEKRQNGPGNRQGRQPLRPRGDREGGG